MTAAYTSKSSRSFSSPSVTNRAFHCEPKNKLWVCPRSFRTYRNQVKAALWPGSVIQMAAILGGVIALRVSQVVMLHPIEDHLGLLDSLFPFSSDTARVVGGSSLFALIMCICITYCRRLILRSLLAFRGWMYEPLGTHSATTVTWALLVKIVSGWSSSMYSYQSCLPGLPVPPLDETLEKLIDSLQPIYENTPERLVELRNEAKEFKETVGYKLQRLLVFRSYVYDNYVTDWWENYVYLMNRSPLTINSNYYIMDQCYWTPTLLQTARAAGTLYQLLLVREQLLSEDFQPVRIRGFIPTCMEQYRRIFSTTRVPGEEMDKLVHYPANQSQHVVVSRRGLMYRVDTTDSGGHLVTPSYLEQQMEWIIADADERYGEVSPAALLIPVLTSQDRTSWAKARRDFFSQGVNRESLEILESAVLFDYRLHLAGVAVTGATIITSSQVEQGIWDLPCGLPTRRYYLYFKYQIILDVNSFSDLSTRAAHLLHGGVGSMWFDKSIQVIAMSDGHIGMNCEHSYADAPAVAHVFEHSLTFEATKCLYDRSGNCVDPCPNKESSKPTLLTWEVGERLQEVITMACSHAKQNIDDLDLAVHDHTEFGKGVIKKCKLSPDAFIQMALHATYRKLTGVPVLTYEASMTRLYKHGRTETVRSLTIEANNFVKAFLDPSVAAEEKKLLLGVACDKHAILYKDAMNGKGIDRHLFALYVASKGMGLDSEFLKKILSLPWTLSTSQQPQQQISWAPNCGDPKYQNLLSPGGGFGPVAEDGYGVSYMVPGDHRIFFHVSSRRSGQRTTSGQFIDTLKVTMTDMIELYGEAPS